MVAWKRLVLWLYNPLALRTAARREHLFAAAPHVDVILLPGTQTRSFSDGEATFTKHSGGRLLIDVGWPRSPLVTSSCGCAIGLGRSMGGQKFVKQVWLPPKELRGRGGVVRLKPKRFDMAFAVLYFPPPADIWLSCRTIWCQCTCRRSSLAFSSTAMVALLPATTAPTREAALGSGARGGSNGSRHRAGTSGEAPPRRKTNRDHEAAGDDDIEEYPPTQAGGGAVQHKRPAEKKDSLAHVKTAKILKVIAKALLRDMQDMRDVASCCIDVLIGPSDDQIFEQRPAQTKESAKLDKQEKEAAGSPHLLAFVNLLAALMAKGPTVVGQANRTTLLSYMEAVKAFTPAQLNEHVRLCKQARCYNSGQREIFLELGRCPARAEILNAVVQAGFAKKGGRALPSYLERDLVDWLQQL